MMTRILPLILSAAAVTACAGPENTAPQPASPPAPQDCNADSVQGMIGERASAETGSRLLQMTGAKTLRWAPPRSALTMDFRHDRLTVSYDDAMLIDRISCG